MKISNEHNLSRFRTSPTCVFSLQCVLAFCTHFEALIRVAISPFQSGSLQRLDLLILLVFYVLVSLLLCQPMGIYT
jgi:hypothetical protein